MKKEKIEKLASPRPNVNIFYDFETCGLFRNGQILNYCFSVTDADNNWNVIDQISGDVKLSLLQLPFAGAIAATRINVIKHNEQATETEMEANKRIRGFLLKRCYGAKPPLLIGYNSAKFDVHQARWSFARTGVSSWVLARGYDVFQGVRDLLLTNPKFREDFFESNEMKRYPSLKLEKMARLMGIDHGPQKHHSEPDVHLLIALFRELNRLYGLTTDTAALYHVEDLHQGEFAQLERVNRRIYPNRYSTKVRAGYIGTVSEKFTIWIRLDKSLEELQADPVASVYILKKGEVPVAGAPLSDVTDSEKKLLAAARELFADKRTLDDLFPEGSAGEYETWIYRSMKIPSYLKKCLDKPEKKSEVFENISERERDDLQYCLMRLELDNCTRDELLTVKWEQFLDFVESRYCGKMIVDKDYQVDSPKEQSEAFHPDFAQMYKEIESELKKAKDPEVIECLLALRQHYHESPIRIAYEALIERGRIEGPKVALPALNSTSEIEPNVSDRGQSLSA